jgi:hypothetical protein
VLGKIAISLAWLHLMALVGPLAAEHAVEYRFVVLGYLKDAKGQPRAGVRVELIREKTGFSYLGETDQAGLYVIVARLGDESLGESLRLRAGDRTVTLAARFDPANHTLERGARWDFLDGRAVDRSLLFHDTLTRFLEGK